MAIHRARRRRGSAHLWSAQSQQWKLSQGRAVIKGEGIGLAPTFLVGEDLTAGRLVPLMPDYTPVESDLTVVYPHRRQLSAKVRSFVDFLAARFAGEPEWDHWRDQTRSREARRIDK